ncbi:sulfatase-like hydrolase/transferase, partial [Bacteroidota bacterium]
IARIKRDFSFISLLLLSAIVSLTDYASSAASDSTSPNFIVILTDDQSWVGTSFLIDPDDPRTKSDYYQTPNMDRLAQMGMRFTDGYAPAPLCNPTRRSLLIGQSTARHFMQEDPDIWTKIYREQLSIPQMLKKTNPTYKAAHFGKWDFRYDLVTPEEMGYDFSDGYTDNGEGLGKGTDWPQAMDDPKLIFSVTDSANKFMENQVAQGNPFYLQVSHYAVHLGMYYTQESLDKYKELAPGEKHFIPEFAAMTEDLDTGIGILLDKVEELGILDNTYIIFLSDNGGRNRQPIGGEQTVPRNFPLRDGKGSLYEGGIRAPFVVAGPNVEANSLSRVPVTGLDIFPTLADLAGYSGTLPRELDGGSIKEVIHSEGTGTVDRNLPYIIFDHKSGSNSQSAIREDSFKLIITRQNDREIRIELFDLASDISEANDLSATMPEKVKDLHDKFDKFIEKVNAETHDAIIVVKNESDEVVQGAEVWLVGYDTLTTDLNGEVVFNDVIAGKKTQLIIEHLEYPKLVSSLEVTTTHMDTFMLSKKPCPLRFIVTDTSGTTLEGVKISVIGVDTLETDISGEVLFTGFGEASDIQYEVFRDGLVSLDGGKTLLKGDTVSIALEPRSLIVKVLDKKAEVVEGASVTLAGYSPLLTDKDGIAIFGPMNPATNVGLEIQADGIYPYASQVTIRNETLTKPVTIESYILRFIIVDSNNMPIESVDVVLDGNTISTASDGFADFLRVPDGVKLPYSINRPGYASIFDSTMVLNKKDTLSHTMYRNSFNMLFVVTDDADDALPGAKVLVSGIDTLITFGEGEILFKYLPPGDYNYVVSNGIKHEEKSGAMSIRAKDDTTYIRMTPLTYNITLTVTGADNIALQGATVTLSGLGVQTSDVDGKVLFEAALPEEITLYTIRKPGYRDTTNILNIVSPDVNITVALVPWSTQVSGINSTDVIELYPIPAEE